MSTGASIFFTILLLFAVLFLLGYLVHNTIDLNGQIQQAKQASEQCQQTSAQLRSSLEATRNENQRLEQENQDLKNLAQKLGQELEAERQGKQQAENETSILQQKAQELEKQLAGKQALSEVAVVQAGIWKNRVDQLTQEQNALETDCKELSRKYDQLKQADSFLRALEPGLDWEMGDKEMAGLLTGSVAIGSGIVAAAGRYARKRRNSLSRPG